MRAAHFIGDFGNPFYTEERQRDVWNEASAFGLQVAVWLTLIASMVTVWLVGRPAVPYVLAAVGLIGLVCLLTIAYAQRLGVSVTTTQRVLRLRLIPYLAGGGWPPCRSRQKRRRLLGFVCDRYGDGSRRGDRDHCGPGAATPITLTPASVRRLIADRLRDHALCAQARGGAGLPALNEELTELSVIDGGKAHQHARMPVIVGGREELAAVGGQQARLVLDACAPEHHTPGCSWIRAKSLSWTRNPGIP